MRNLIIHSVATLGLPLLLLIGSFVAAPQLEGLSPTLIAWLAPLTTLLLASGLLLALLFNRSRALFLIIFMTLLYLLITSPLPWNALASNRDALHQLLCLLVPINFIIFPWLRERGVLTRAGSIRVALLCIPLVIVMWLAAQHSAIIWPLLTTPIIPIATSHITPLPQLAMVLIIAAMMLQLFRALRYRTHLEWAFLGALCGSTAALHYVSLPLATALFIATSALIMTIALLRESHHMAYRDQLTGLPARRALQENLLKLGSRYVIAMVDVDHFKKFNDTYGHDVGDQVLKLVGSRLLQVSGGGKPARYGGEEFTLLFPGKEIEQVREHAERLREAIAQSSFKLRSQDRPKVVSDDKAQKVRKGESNSGDTTVSVTVSIGLAQRTTELTTPEQVMKEADEALYRAKAAGRNRVSV